MTKPLTPPDPSGIRRIQESFAAYQVKAFDERGPAFFALELAGECGELANLEKKTWRNPAQELPLEKFSEEAADVMITLMNYCNARGINLEDAMYEKLERIEGRRLRGEMGRSRDCFGE